MQVISNSTTVNTVYINRKDMPQTLYQHKSLQTLQSIAFPKPLTLVSTRGQGDNSCYASVADGKL